MIRNGKHAETKVAESSNRKSQHARPDDAPVTTHSVTDLTSLFRLDEPEHWGDRGHPADRGEKLIHDLLMYFQPRRVLDPMSGSGTCRDICSELGIECVSTDLHAGFDACDSSHYRGKQRFDFIWLHPPYWRQIRYSDNPRDLSCCSTLAEYFQRCQLLIENCANALLPQGRLAILVGDYSDHELGYVPLTYHIKRLAFATGLRQCCTDILRFSHRTSGSSKVYRTSFVSNLHDVCMVFTKVD